VWLRAPHEIVNETVLKAFAAVRGIRVDDLLPVVVSGAKFGEGEIPLHIAARMHVRLAQLGFPRRRHFGDVIRIQQLGALRLILR
jgi:hypothetical protein